ncbi:MAG: amidohydrolase family protein [Hamadaea sp.]|uniref:amidohydrolase family protein n=1 Tax=Hamadaea sp. TaxID=2024425 RepID=UPI0017B0B913|nr:amidohydrolase family protein [Hamadaea sp.]NUR49085.1 amidohydrolase family protein [Hamadaea sp.]NUR70824.1 amidohydrolase family protein [Hamadaea sp.]NUT19930.1 amidohydrolase family protein [Hamadaea sp.]
MIDAHHHLWTAGYAWLAEPALTPIRRDYTVDDLRANLTRAGVTKTVLVEAGRCDDAETTEFLALAERTPEIAAVVGWLDPLDPRLAAKIAAHRAGPGGSKLAGVRSQVQAEADPDFLARPDVIDGLAVIADTGLVFDLVIRADQIPGAVVAAKSLSQARLVLDHLGKPQINAGSPAERSAWRIALENLAACPNVVAKLSGLVTEADWASWQLADLRPYAQTALDLFGPDRLLWGSDWPVVELAGGYERWLAAARELIPADLHTAVFTDNAARTYGLD